MTNQTGEFCTETDRHVTLVNVSLYSLMIFSVWTDPVEGRCPVKLTPVPLEKPGRSYSECVIVHVWMKDVGTESN